MYYSEMLAETVFEPADYQKAEKEENENGWAISTYPVEGAQRINGYRLCDLWVSVISPSGEAWVENRGPIHTNDGVREAEGAIQTARWVKAHWAEVMQSQC